MSAAKMVADSTQSDLPDVSATKKRKKMTQKKKVKKKKQDSGKKGKSKNPEEEFDLDDLDLDNDIRSLSYYVKDREVLLDQLFHCVKGGSLQRTLPEALKDLPLDDLKKRCLEELEVMSRKRIRRIVTGDDPATISSSGTEDESSADEQNWEDEETYAREEDEDEDDMHFVDSTSVQSNTPRNSESLDELEYQEDPEEEEDDDREHEEGSLGHRSHTPPYSDNEQFEQLDTESKDVQYEEEDMDEAGANVADTVEAEVEETEPMEREEPEEGEVLDDDADMGGRGSGDRAEIVDDGEVLEEKKQIDTVEEQIDDVKEVPKNVEGDDDGDGGEGDSGEKVVDDRCESGATEEEKGGGADADSGECSDEDGEAAEGNAADMSISDVVVSEVKAAQGSQRIVKPPAAEAIAPVLTKNQMELLELQMRARAIKAMLKNS